MNVDTIRTIGERIGQVLEVEAGEDGGCVGKYTRVRVSLDITKPLMQGIWVQPEQSQDEICIILVYERLPNFFFVCGRLGHVLKDCGEKDVDGAAIKFGNWLRAPVSVGERKYFTSSTHSTRSSGSPFGTSPGSSKRIATVNTNLLLLEAGVKSDFLQDYSDMVDNNGNSVKVMINNLSTSDDDAIIHWVEEVADGDKQLDSCEQVVMTPSKKKWKRLTRGVSNEVPKSKGEVPGCKVSKRTGIPKEIDGDSKKLRVVETVEEA